MTASERTPETNKHPLAGYEERLWAKVILVGDCWLWTAGCSTDSYGRFNPNGETQQAHRVVYKLLIGPIPSGKVLRHMCHVTLCVNPWHTVPSTDKENLYDSDITWAVINARKTTCPNGHPYDAVKNCVDGKRRRCSICHNEQQHAKRERIREWDCKPKHLAPAAGNVH